MNQAEIEKKLEELRVIGKAALSEREYGWPVDDKAYASRMQAALAQINKPDCPAGMIPWLGEAHPELYNDLTSRIPDEIDLAWKCRAPLAEFDAILARLVEMHQVARRLYRQHLQKPSETVLERPQGAERTK